MMPNNERKMSNLPPYTCYYFKINKFLALYIHQPINYSLCNDILKRKFSAKFIHQYDRNI